MHGRLGLRQSIIAAGRVIYLDIMTVSTGLLSEKGPRDGSGYQESLRIFWQIFRKKNQFVFLSCYVVIRSNGKYSISKRQAKF